MNCPHWNGKKCLKYDADCPVEGCTILKAYEEYRLSLQDKALTALAEITTNKDKEMRE